MKSNNNEIKNLLLELEKVASLNSDQGAGSLSYLKNNPLKSVENFEIWNESTDNDHYDEVQLSLSIEDELDIISFNYQIQEIQNLSEKMDFMLSEIKKILKMR